jgi:hypothetical protein
MLPFNDARFVILFHIIKGSMCLLSLVQNYHCKVVWQLHGQALLQCFYHLFAAANPIALFLCTSLVAAHFL